VKWWRFGKVFVRNSGEEGVIEDPSSLQAERID
jgi:hypothetical protein